MTAIDTSNNESDPSSTSNAATISQSVSGSGGGSGGGGGGLTPIPIGTSTTSTIPVSTTTTTTTATTTAPTTTPTITTTTISITPEVKKQTGLPKVKPKVKAKTKALAIKFKRNLTIGSTGDDVKDLQTFLENKGFLKMPKGIAKGYFGPLTASALKAYQKSVGLSATGYFGTTTREKIIEEMGIEIPKEKPIKPKGKFKRPLWRGSKGEDVKLLQEILAKKGFYNGSITGYFGSLTEKAVQEFQLQYKITTKNNPAFGFVGPSTRAKLNELLDEE